MTSWLRSLKFQSYSEYLVFLSVGLCGMFFAFFVSSGFMDPVFSQQPPNAPQNSPEGELPSATTERPNENGDKSFARDNFVAEVQSYLEPFIYDPKGRRDPFGPFQENEVGVDGEFQGPLLPLQRFDVSELKLIGVIWDVNDPKAMFLDPNKQIHMVGKDERVGRNNGYIAVIREGEVVVVEANRRKGELLYSSVVVRIEQ